MICAREVQGVRECQCKTINACIERRVGYKPTVTHPISMSAVDVTLLMAVQVKNNSQRPSAVPRDWIGAGNAVLSRSLVEREPETEVVSACVFVDVAHFALTSL